MAKQWQDMEWTFSTRPDGTLAPENVTHALLIDIRSLLREIRGMMSFFKVLAIIALVFGFLIVVITVLSHI